MMKPLFLLIAVSITAMVAAQTNTFPSSGPVGIGTTSPGSTLSVSGSSSLVLPPGSIAGIGTIDPQEVYRATLSFTGTPVPVSSISVSVNAKWKVIFRGAWVNNYEGGGLPQPAPYIELSSESPSIAIGTITFTVSRDATTGKLSGTSTSNVAEKTIGFSGTIEIISNNIISPGTNSMILTGGIGIGTSTPVEKLQVSGGRIYANGTGTSSGFTLNNWSLHQTNANEFKLRYDMSDIFTANAAGNIGIGTATPAEKLQVSGGRIYANGTGTSSGFTLNNWSLYQTNTSEFKLRYDMSDIFTANTAGNIGIGTNSPTDKLSVNGSIKAKKLIITQQNWSDYVFHPDYQLQPLSQVEAFVKKNNHLPDIPSAREVAEKGISVGDNQALLLKKIEELTLYLLQQDKKIKNLEKKIAGLARNNSKH